MENNINMPITNHQEFRQIQVPLPNSTVVLVLGILSIVLCGIGLVLGIIAIILGNKSKNLYKENPKLYTFDSYNNLQVGYICALIGLSLSILYIIFLVLYFFIWAFVFVNLLSLSTL